EILNQIEIFGLQDQIINVGPLEQEQLNRLYCNSHALFLPTYLESFSGTYLEAMHFGVPIITSDLDFAHCICGEAACYIDPTNIDSMLKGIRKLIDFPNYYLQLVNNGALQKSKYEKSWEEIVCSVLDNENIDHCLNKKT
ncbi:glycosyltransferase, partial [bacterium]|nr:glycosyltransferase [bacterium]